MCLRSSCEHITQCAEEFGSVGAHLYRLVMFCARSRFVICSTTPLPLTMQCCNREFFNFKNHLYPSYYRLTRAVPIPAPVPGSESQTRSTAVRTTKKRHETRATWILGVGVQLAPLHSGWCHCTLVDTCASSGRRVVTGDTSGKSHVDIRMSVRVPRAY